MLALLRTRLAKWKPVPKNYANSKKARKIDEASSRATAGDTTVRQSRPKRSKTSKVGVIDLSSIAESLPGENDTGASRGQDALFEQDGARGAPPADAGTQQVMTMVDAANLPAAR